MMQSPGPPHPIRPWQAVGDVMTPDLEAPCRQPARLEQQGAAACQLRIAL